VKSSGKRAGDKKETAGADQRGGFFPHIRKSFGYLNALCLKVEKGEMEPAVIRRELVKQWGALQTLFKVS
jgi:hypothetical protein